MDNFQEFIKSLVNNDTFLSYLHPFIVAILFFVLGHYVAKIIAGMVRRLMYKQGAADLLTDFIGKVVYVAVYMVPLMAGLQELGLNLTSVMALLGAMGLAVGLALKDSLANFAAGVIISVLGPFRTDDFVEIAGLSGTVKDVTLFSTELTTADNKLITIPNGSIISSPITNFTAKNTRRIDMVIGVSYDDDLKVARQVMTDVLNSHPKVLKEPATTVMLLDLADSSINFACRPWVKKEDYWSVRDNLLESFKEKLEAAGCSFPYPQQDIHLYTETS